MGRHHNSRHKDDTHEEPLMETLGNHKALNFRLTLLLCVYESLCNEILGDSMKTPDWLARSLITLSRIIMKQNFPKTISP